MDFTEIFFLQILYTVHYRFKIEDDNVTLNSDNGLLHIRINIYSYRLWLKSKWQAYAVNTVKANEITE